MYRAFSRLTFCITHCPSMTYFKRIFWIHTPTLHWMNLFEIFAETCVCSRIQYSFVDSNRNGCKYFWCLCAYCNLCRMKWIFCVLDRFVKVNLFVSLIWRDGVISDLQTLPVRDWKMMASNMRDWRSLLQDAKNAQRL